LIFVLEVRDINDCTELVIVGKQLHVHRFQEGSMMFCCMWRCIERQLLVMPRGRHEHLVCFSRYFMVVLIALMLLS